MFRGHLRQRFYYITNLCQGLETSEVYRCLGHTG
jgi:hypothetical protein